jgi:hypothetical protein
MAADEQTQNQVKQDKRKKRTKGGFTRLVIHQTSKSINHYFQPCIHHCKPLKIKI